MHARICAEVGMGKMLQLSSLGDVQLAVNVWRGSVLENAPSPSDTRRLSQVHYQCGHLNLAGRFKVELAVEAGDCSGVDSAKMQHTECGERRGFVAALC